MTTVYLVVVAFAVYALIRSVTPPERRGRPEWFDRVWGWFR